MLRSSLFGEGLAFGDVSGIYGQATHLGEGGDLAAAGALRLEYLRSSVPASCPTAFVEAYFGSIQHRWGRLRGPLT